MSQQMEHARATPSRCLLPPMRKGKDTVFASLNLFTSLTNAPPPGEYGASRLALTYSTTKGSLLPFPLPRVCLLSSTDHSHTCIPHSYFLHCTLQRPCWHWSSWYCGGPTHIHASHPCINPDKQKLIVVLGGHWCWVGFGEKARHGERENEDLRKGGASRGGAASEYGGRDWKAGVGGRELLQDCRCIKLKRKQTRRREGFEKRKTRSDEAPPPLLLDYVCICFYY